MFADVPIDLAVIATGGDGALQRRFGGIPFSVMNTAGSTWQARKKWWIGQGICSEVGRSAKTYNNADYAPQAAAAPSESDGTSIFDPVLTEMMYRWLCPASGMIVDPFAGGSVRGIVAGWGGYQYHGIELRPEQVAANERQRDSILGPNDIVTWVTGDAADHLPNAPVADLLFTCPPYYDLEVYSDDPADLSTFPTYEQFLTAYGGILGMGVDRLDNDRFAVVVVGDMRDKRTGYMRPFVADTIAAMQSAGAMYHQEVVIVTPAGTLPQRTGKQFETSRKFGKQHQQALVFVKGDARKATANIESLAS